MDKGKYDQIKTAIFDILKKEKEVNFTQLGKKVESKIGKTFSGSVMWYYVSVKLDLEARGVLMRVPNTNPQMVKFKRIK